jgi:hypothetical protein
MNVRRLSRSDGSSSTRRMADVWLDTAGGEQCMRADGQQPQCQMNGDRPRPNCATQVATARLTCATHRHVSQPWHSARADADSKKRRIRLARSLQRLWRCDEDRNTAVKQTEGGPLNDLWDREKRVPATIVVFFPDGSRPCPRAAPFLCAGGRTWMARPFRGGARLRCGDPTKPIVPPTLKR